MSYPSIAGTFEGLNLDTSSHTQEVFWEAFEKDLPLGTAYLLNFANETQSSFFANLICILSFGLIDFRPYHGIEWHDPASKIGKELVRLLGCDLSRSVCEQKLGMRFGLYNCCGVEGTKGKGKVKLSYQTQALRQLTPDC